MHLTSAKTMVASMESVSFPNDDHTLFLDTDASQVGTGGYLFHLTQNVFCIFFPESGKDKGFAGRETN